MDATYHAYCLTLFYRRHEKHCNLEESDNNAETAHSVVFAELTAYIEEVNGTPPSFRLADLTKLYSSRLAELGICEVIHTTRLKNRILPKLTDLRAEKDGCTVHLMFDKDVATKD